MNNVENLSHEFLSSAVEVRTLSECTALRAGDRVTKADMDENGKFPAYGAGIVPTGHLNRSNFSDCLIVSRAGAGAGYVNFIEGEFWATDVCFVASQLAGGPLIKFVYYWMKTNEQDLMRQTYGGSMPKINKKYLWDHPVPVPPLSMQQQIVEKLDKLTQLQGQLEAELQAEIKARRDQYQYYRKLLFSFKGIDAS
jgi:type I restriction enzyme S subunit